MDQTRVPALFPIIARGDLFAPIIDMRCAEADAVDRAQRLLRGEGAGPLWRRLSDAIGRRARRMRLYWVMRAHRGLSTMPGLGRTRAQRRADRADADIGPHWMFASQAEPAAYGEQERIAIRWAYLSELEHPEVLWRYSHARRA